jgi:small subunit ribosomal protein S4
MKTFGAIFKMCRRLGPQMHEKCQSQAFLKSEARHAGSGKNMKRKKAPSAYGVQLLEKQKIRLSYGIGEKQFAGYVKKASLTKHPVDALYQTLETRLDNVIYRLGFATTRPFARQLVAHGHIMVNGKRVKAPSALVSLGDVVSVRPESISAKPFIIAADRLKNQKAPLWLTLDAKTLSGTVKLTPKQQGENFLNFNTVLEFYAR